MSDDQAMETDAEEEPVTEGLLLTDASLAQLAAQIVALTTERSDVTVAEETPTLAAEVGASSAEEQDPPASPAEEQDPPASPAEEEDADTRTDRLLIAAGVPAANIERVRALMEEQDQRLDDAEVKRMVADSEAYGAPRV